MTGEGSIMRYGYYDDDGEWISEPYVGFGGTLAEAVASEPEAEEQSIEDVRLQLIGITYPHITTEMTIKNYINTLKALEDYVYSE